jgi:spore germination protein GerM
MTGLPRRLRAAVLGAPALVVAALLGACGVPADDEPRAIDQEHVSEEITEDTAEGLTDTATLYLTRSGASGGTLLAPAEWQVPVGTSSTSPTPTTALETLLAFQPDETAQEQGLGTQIPPNTRLVGPLVIDDEGVLTVDLNETLYGMPAPASSLAFGQVVCTAAAFGEVGAVRFEQDGQPRRVPMGDGESSGQPLTCDSYANLVEPGTG